MNETESQLKALNIDLKDVIAKATEKIEQLLKIDAIKEAEILVKQLLVVDPTNAAGLQLYGLILYRQRKYHESIEVINKAIALDDSNAENYNNVALSYLHSGQSKEAMEAISKARQLQFTNHNFLNNQGLIYRAMGDSRSAIVCFQNAINMVPDDVKTWENLGSAYGHEKMLDRAIECFQKALELDPKTLAAHVDLAYAYHLQGDWEKAWPEYEHRLEYWHSVGRNPGRFYDIYKPEFKWDGKTSLQGKTIAVYCEQGVGDMLQFVRFVPKLKELGGKVLLDCPENLATLFKEFGEVRTNYNEQGFDFHCSILSLPYLLNMMTPDKFLSDKPYIFSDEKLDMTDYKNHFNIGICWAGNPGHPNDGNRSVPLSYFRKIYELPNVKLFSLQKDVAKRVYANRPDLEIDLAAGCDDMKLVNVSDFMTDFLGTASVINSMDLIITVDTSILHLAGAMGKNTWALIPFNPDWRWTLSGERTDWYANTMLFRQPVYGDWQSVFDLIYNKLLGN